MFFDKKWKNQNWFQYAVALCIAILFYTIINNIDGIQDCFSVLYGFISPVVLGVIIAYLLNPVMSFYERTIFSRLKQQSFRRSFSLILTVITFLLFFSVLLIALIPQIVSSLTTLFANVDEYSNTLQMLLEKLKETAAKFKLDISSFTAFSDNFLSTFKSSIPNGFNSIVNTSVNIGSGILNAVISFILAIYFLADKEHLIGGWSNLLGLLVSDKHKRDWVDFWTRCNTILLRYIGGDLLDALIVGVVNWIFMLAFGMPYAVLISLIVGVTNLAPTFGPIVGAVIGGFILVLVNPWSALWFLIFTIVLQTCDGYIIKPKLFGNTLGIASVWILVSIIVFGRVFGIVGVLLAIPFAAIIDFIYREFFLVWLKRKKDVGEFDDNEDDIAKDENVNKKNS
ncbi:AI-2E family transporter [Butyrivibrio sp. NC3005]|uniref:AI-2E family transporter n=1 Tax=Butyrivibrio sp. NC3005 TaxID=1280685 RepID=UPI0003FD2D0C|nr:AI-2E family transporter [Butyrivibrio sp. NC3005]